MKHFISLLCLLVLIQTTQAQIYTPNSVEVPVSALFAYSGPQYSDSQLDSDVQAIENGLYGSSCVVLRGWSKEYNCHGYAWHVSTGGSQVGINQPTYGGVD